MAQVLNLSGPGLDLALYGDRGNFFQDYLRNQMTNIIPMVGEIGERIMGSIQTAHNFVTDQLTNMGIRNELQQQGLEIMDNYYAELLHWEALQQATPVMQRWVMANPAVRDMYLKQDIAGYDDEYTDLDPGSKGDDHYDYRRVMTGMFQDGPKDEWVVKHYFDDLMPGDRELTHYEKVDVLNTWRAVDHILNTCDFDFTAKTDEPVKFNR